MATVTVTDANTNTTVNDSTSNTNWGNWGSSGGAPASEAQLAYQGGSAVNKKINSTSLGGIDYDPGAGALDMTAAANRLWLAKVIVSDSFDVNTTRGLIVAAGSANNAYRAWNLAGSASTNNAFTEYNPAQGGYIIVAIAPDVTFWHDSVVTSGTPSWTAVDWFGAQCALINGLAKNENLALDAIDVGTGLQLYGGDGVDADGTFQDFVDADQGTVANRWGYASASFGSIFLRGMMEIGVNNTTPTATEFTPPASQVVIFPDMFIDNGLIGTTFDLGSASTVITLPNTILGQGGLYNSGAIDTRPDMIFTGTSGSATITGSVVGHRNITLTSAVDVDGARLGCVLLTQATAHIRDSTIVTLSPANTATIQDPTFGSTSGLHDLTFIQGSAGHAIELDTATSYTFNNITFDGYNASNGQADSALFVNVASGTVTINVVGGDSPTYRLPGGSTATVDIVVDPVTTTITVQDITDSSLLQNVRVLLWASGNNVIESNAGGGGDLAIGNGISQGYYSRAQSFQVPVDSVVSRIGVTLKKDGSPTDEIFMTLYLGADATTPIATATNTFSGSAMSTSYSTLYFNFEPVLLSASTTYNMRIQRTGSVSVANHYDWAENSTPGYSNGQTFRVSNVDVYVGESTDGEFSIEGGTVYINDLTNVSGVVSDQRPFASDTPITGWARRASSGFGTLYKQGAIAGTISSTSGLSTTVQLIPDE